jgi:hypothetical protein
MAAALAGRSSFEYLKRKETYQTIGQLRSAYIADIEGEVCESI